MKAKFGFEFDSIEKVNEFNNECTQCFGGCRDVNDPPEEACKKCEINIECMKFAKENGYDEQ